MYKRQSESCALDAAGATLLRDVEPGEIVVADAKTGELRSITDHVGRPDTQKMCIRDRCWQHSIPFCW